MPDPIGGQSSTTPAINPVTISVTPTRNGRTSGKAWKQEKTATRRSYINPSVKSSFAARKEKELRQEAVKGVEREMRDEKAAEAERKRTALKERRERQAEKIRMEEAKAKMSAKKLQRMKKRQGRSKKING